METAEVTRMKELVQKLNEAAKAYYQEDREIMSNREYDALYDELEQTEKITGIVLADSPTVRVGYEAVDALPKETHDSPMLSLDKTKEREVLRGFVGSHKTLLSWKMDGLTIVLTYENGELQKAVTRGNGIVGEVITNNARVFRNIPLKIAYQGRLVLRGEAIITYSDFERINNSIEDVDAKYKNPRNLCSGSVRQLNNQITAERNVRFFAFALVSAQDVDMHNSREFQMEWLRTQGFEVVEYRVVTSENLDEAMDYFAEKIITNDFPSDGLVALYDDIAYGESLGSTAKFPRNAFAFKWADEVRETTLREIEWSPSRTGLINPVAVFDPVELEGTTVSRASVHNVSIVKDLKLGIGDTIQVYKANMIIPQIAENLTQSGNLEIPNICPVCGQEAKVLRENDVEALYCMNPDCVAKKIKAFTLFVSRDAMNIDGLSEATLEKFIQNGLIKDFTDLYHLDRYKDIISGMEGFGEKSCENILNAVEQSRKTIMAKVIYSLGIPGIGLSNAKMIVKAIGSDKEQLTTADRPALEAVKGVGAVLADAFVSYFENENNRALFEKLLKELDIEKEEDNNSENADALEGKVFVITGSLSHFNNRNELKDLIESMGGKVTGSVTGNTSYLINNDVTSTSSKNKNASKLGIPIISEEEFLDIAGRKDLM